MPVVPAILVLLSGLAAAGDPPLPEPAPAADAALATVAERSGYKATARHAEVMAQLDAVAKTSPRARRVSMGRTGEDREIPVILFADPPVATPDEARAQVKTGKLMVLIFANIHAGECDGKEALGILARELATVDHHPLLKNLIIALAPDYNADGNERVGPTDRHRPGQVGPDEGCGRRENAAGLDLNRDFIKLEAPETRALVGFLNAWDPHVVVDCHTTDGSWHRYLVTTAGPKSPAGDPRLLAFSRDRFFPALFERFEAATGRPAFWYGNFEGEFGDAERGHTKWESFPAEARYGTTAIGLRGRLSVLVESYSYAPYKDRVLGSLAFCRSILELADQKRGEIRDLAEHPDRPEKVAIRSRAVPEGKAVIKGFKEITADGRSTSTGEPMDYQVDLWNRFDPVLEVEVPEAYAILNPDPKVESTLRAHGLTLAHVAADAPCEVEIQTVTDAKSASRQFQGHAMVTLDTRSRRERTTLPKGALLIPTNQPLGRLAVYLLEPRSEDGLATWNFFDAACRTGADFPVLRLPKGAPLPAIQDQPGAPGAPAAPPGDPRREPPASPHLE